jgi:FkbM family methyltransferase
VRERGLLRGVSGKLRAVLKHLAQAGPERQVAKHWLLKPAGAMNRGFRADNQIHFSSYENYQRIDVQGQSFLWPKSFPREFALNILAELFVADHPHQYLYGATPLAADDVVLDIGACEGSFAAYVAARCREVVCVEPSPAMCALIPRLFALRQLPAPRVLQCLLGAGSGLAHFYDDASNPAASRIVDHASDGAYPVPVRTLDEVAEALERKPTFIKCDAEGAEPLIFAGGARFLRRHHPRLAITTYHNDGDYRAMFDLLRSFDYQVEGKGLLYSPERSTLRVQMIHAWA